MGSFAGSSTPTTTTTTTSPAVSTWTVPGYFGRSTVATDPADPVRGPHVERRPGQPRHVRQLCAQHLRQLSTVHVRAVLVERAESDAVLCAALVYEALGESGWSGATGTGGCATAAASAGAVSWPVWVLSGDSTRGHYARLSVEVEV